MVPTAEMDFLPLRKSYPSQPPLRSSHENFGYRLGLLLIMVSVYMNRLFKLRLYVVSDDYMPSSNNAFQMSSTPLSYSLAAHEDGKLVIGGQFGHRRMRLCRHKTLSLERLQRIVQLPFRNNASRIGRLESGPVSPQFRRLRKQDLLAWSH